MNVSISAVIPAWNRARTVGAAIESAATQRLRPSEIIVVDDGSTDETAAVVQSSSYAVRYIWQAHAGVSKARNRGVMAGRSDWIAFLDSDDQWDPHHLSRIETAIKETKGEADLYFSDTRMPAEEGGGTIWERARMTVPGDYLLVPDATEWALRDYQPMMLQSSVIRKAAYQQLGGLWEALRIREDTHLFLKLSIGRSVCAVAGVGAVMTSVAERSRLTKIFGDSREAYWRCSALMWRDALDRHPALERRYRRKLRRRLGTSFQKLARFAALRGEVGNSLRLITQAAALNPSALVCSIGRKIDRALS